jgi:MFS family permease
MNTTSTSPQKSHHQPSQNVFVRNIRTFFTTPAALAVGLVFASDSLLFGSWVGHIPYIKEKLAINDAELGLTLFAMPVGLLIMNPITGLIVARLGEARACFWAAIGLCIGMSIPINAPNPVILAAGLLLVGMGAALINVAMNTLATNVEKQYGISIMSSCHGMWSLGGVIGSGLAGAAIALHIAPSIHVMAMIASILALTFALQPTLKTVPSQSSGESGASFVLPNLDLLIMILIGFAVAMGEGVAFDWSAVYLRDNAGATRQIAALGFAAFSVTMTTGRFLGDAIIPRIGPKRFLIGGGMVAASGLLVAILLPYPTTVLLGFALLGAGCSLGAPILYAASLRIPGIAPAAGLATFATFSFVGFLAGPPVIGFVSESIGLVWGFVMVGVLLLISAMLARVVKGL